MPIDKDLLERIQQNRYIEPRLAEPTLLLIGDDQNDPDNMLTDEDVALLAKALRHNTQIRRLELDGNQISDAGAESLAALSRKCPSFESLSISGNQITAKGAAALAKSLFKKIDLGGNPLGDGVGQLALAPQLKELHADGCQVTDEGARQLFSNKTIKLLNLSSNEITGSCLEGLASNGVLERLILNQNSSLKAQYLRFLVHSKAPSYLHLAGVRIDEQGASYLAQSQSLQGLILMGCFIEDPVAIALSQSRVKRMVLASNWITDRGGVALLHNPYFLHLDLKGNRALTSEFTQNALKHDYQTGEKNVFTRTEEYRQALLKKPSLNTALANSNGQATNASAPSSSSSSNHENASLNGATFTPHLNGKQPKVGGKRSAEEQLTPVPDEPAQLVRTEENELQKKNRPNFLGNNNGGD